MERDLGGTSVAHGIQGVGEDEEHDGREQHAAEEPEQRLADPERQREVEDHDAEVEERLEQPAVAEMAHPDR